MATTRKALIRGGVVGCVIGLPVGVAAGLFFARMLMQTFDARAYAFIVLVTLAFVAWGGFLGAMLKAQADEPT